MGRSRQKQQHKGLCCTRNFPRENTRSPVVVEYRPHPQRERCFPQGISLREVNEIEPQLEVVIMMNRVFPLELLIILCF